MEFDSAARQVPQTRLIPPSRMLDGVFRHVRRMHRKAAAQAAAGTAAPVHDGQDSAASADATQGNEGDGGPGLAAASPAATGASGNNRSRARARATVEQAIVEVAEAETRAMSVLVNACGLSVKKAAGGDEPLRRILRGILLVCGLRPSQASPVVVREAVATSLQCSASDPFVPADLSFVSRRRAGSGGGTGRGAPA